MKSTIWKSSLIIFSALVVTCKAGQKSPQTIDQQAARRVTSEQADAVLVFTADPSPNDGYLGCLLQTGEKYRRATKVVSNENNSFY